MLKMLLLLEGGTLLDEK